MLAALLLALVTPPQLLHALPPSRTYLAVVGNATPEGTSCPTPLLVDGVVVAPVRISGSTPRGAVLFKGCSSAGVPIISFTVSNKGRPTALQLVRTSGCDAADKRAFQAVRGWRYEPAFSNGRAISHPVTATIMAGN